MRGIWRGQVQKAQQRQKHQHDRRAQDPGFRVGDRVFVYMPAKKSGKAHKFAKPFQGPYRIVSLFENGAEVRLVDKPSAGTIRVALNRVRRCPCDIPDSRDEQQGSVELTAVDDAATSLLDGSLLDDPETTETIAKVPGPSRTPGIWSDRLRPRN